MIQLYPDAGLVQLLLRLVGAAGIKFRLFSNDITPDDGTVLGDLTLVPSSDSGAPVVVDTDFLIQTVSGGVGSIVAGPVTFVNASGVGYDCYGYAITDVGGTHLLACARFDGAPVAFPVGTGSISVLPILSNDSLY